MFPTDALREDHQLMKRMCRAVNAVSERLERGEDVPIRAMENIVDFVRNFWLKYHLDREAAVFTRSHHRATERESPEMAAALMTHQEGQNSAEGMWEALFRFRDGVNEAKLDFADDAIEYVQCMSGHIGEEERILFPKIEEVLTEDDRRYLSQKFGEIDAEQAGGRRQHYQQMVTSLENDLGGA